MVWGCHIAIFHIGMCQDLRKNHMTAEITIHSPAILGYHPVPSGFWLMAGFIHHPLKRRPFTSGTVPLARWNWQLQSWTSKTAGATLGCIFKQTIDEYKTYVFMYICEPYICEPYIYIYMVHIYIYVYIYVCVYIYIYIYVYIYICVHTFFSCVHCTLYNSTYLQQI